MPKRILLVDDEEILIDSLKRVLVKKGYDVLVAYDGVEAVELAKSEDFDLIITDIRMPKLDGISTIKIIRDILQSDGKKKVPEILITGYAKEEYMGEAKKLGVFDCLYKPMDVWTLLKSIKGALDS